LNHPITDLGIPPDSQRRETALAVSSANAVIFNLTSCAVLTPM
jgi:hypothetical protein